MKIYTYLLTLITLITLTGCASTDEIKYDTSVRQPTTTIDVYKDGAMPTKRYKEISELSYLGPREDELAAQRFFMKRARKLGGNAIILQVFGAGSKGDNFHFSTAWLFKGKVVVYE